MIVYNNINNIPHKERVVVIGNFDGLHRGHQKLIHAGSVIREEKKLVLTVLTFYPQWQSVRDPAFCYLLSQFDKFSMLEKMGVDEVITIPFDTDFASVSAERFVSDILLEKLNVQHVVVGYNFTYGHLAQGNADTLTAALESQGKGIFVQPPYMFKGNVISSSLIRRQIKDGNLSLVNQLLGYPYHICGEVIPGHQIGRTIGFPTANIDYDLHILLPAPGVYAAKAWLTRYPDTLYKGVLNIGTRPTVDSSSQITIEMNLLDFDQDIYGEDICIEVHHLLRHISKFKDLKELKLAISNDVKNAKKILK